MFKRLLSASSFIIVLSLTLLVSCAPTATQDLPPRVEQHDSTVITLPAALDGIASPESYERMEESFDTISYVTPDTEALIRKITEARDTIIAEVAEFDEICTLIDVIDDDYGKFLSAKTYLTIATARDSTNEYYASEYSLLTEAQSTLSDILESMLVAAAKSCYGERLEKEYFYVGFVEQYASEKISDKVAELLLAETKLENEYKSLTPDTVTITYDGRTASYTEICDYLCKRYPSDSYRLSSALSVCEKLYKEKRASLCTDIFVELVRTRKLIATELGYASYTEYAYENIHHDYSPEDMKKLSAAIAEYIVPVYATLEDKVFYNFFTKNAPYALSTEPMTSTLGAILRATDARLGGIYGYMEHYGLVSVAQPDGKRQSGAFTTYLQEHKSPYVFVTADGTSNDYIVLAHEFGHFADYFINGSSDASLDMHEISSQALELLTLNMLGSYLSSDEYRFLKYSEMRSVMTTMIYQCFYSTFEHLAYDLPYDSINRESLTALVGEAAEKMNLSRKHFSDLSLVMIDHTVLYPHYVQSYAVSLIPSLEIYFTELETSGAGFSIYNSLLDNDGAETLGEHLSSVGLSDPFESSLVRSIADKIHYMILGSHYYSEAPAAQSKPNAA